MSATQYRPALIAAEADLQATRAKVAEWLISQQASINEVAIYARTVTPSLANCQSLAGDLHTLLSDPRVGIVARSRAKEECERLIAEAMELERTAAAAEKALEARSLLASAEDKKLSEPVQAVRLLRQAEECIRNLPLTVQCVADAADAARVATRAIHNAFKSALQDYFPVSSLRIACQRPAAATARLTDMLEAVRSLSDALWLSSLTDIASRIRGTVLTPLLQATNVQINYTEDNNVPALTGTNLPISSLSSSLPLDNSVALLKFVRAAFVDCHDAGKHVANALWAELQSYVQEKYILDTLPSIYADITNYHAPTRVAELEKLGSELGVEAASAATLTNIAKDVDGNFVKALAGRILGALRATLLDERWDGVQVGEYESLAVVAEGDGTLFDQSPLWFPRCTVSTKSQACINAVRALLDATTGASPAAATALWRSARDAAALYITLVLYAHKAKLAQVPRFALLYYTDCMYLAHELPFVACPWKSLPNAQTLSFVDISETTREVAEEHFTQLLRQYEGEALELMAGAEGFAYTHLPGPRGRAEGAIKQTIHFCQQQTSMCAGVLPAHMNRAIADAVVDKVFTSSVSAVLRLTDIDRDARLSDLLLDLLPLATDSEKNIPSLERFRMLVTLLDARLVDIPTMYEEGKLRTFAPNELQALLQALFTDSPLRQTALQRIWAASAKKS